METGPVFKNANRKSQTESHISHSIFFFFPSEANKKSKSLQTRNTKDQLFSLMADIFFSLRDNTSQSQFHTLFQFFYSFFYNY